MAIELKVDDVAFNLHRHLPSEEDEENNTNAPGSERFVMIASRLVPFWWVKFGSSGEGLLHFCRERRRAAKIDQTTFEGGGVNDDVFVFEVAMTNSGRVHTLPHLKELRKNDTNRLLFQSAVFA